MKEVQILSTRMKPIHTVSLVLLTLAVAQIACGAGTAPADTAPTLFILPTNGPAAQSSAQPAPATEASVLAATAPLPVATEEYVGSAGEGDPIDLCTLPTPDEVAAVIGGPYTKTSYYDYGQFCTFSLDSQNTRFLFVQAGHDQDGKVMHLSSLDSYRDKITDQSALQLLDQLDAQFDSLTLPELVKQALPVWRAAGFTAEEEPGIAQWGVWFWGYGQPGTVEQLGQVGVGRASGAWLAVYTNASDEATAKALLRPLAAALLARLPDNFTPTGTNTP